MKKFKIIWFGLFLFFAISASLAISKEVFIVQLWVLAFQSLYNFFEDSANMDDKKKKQMQVKNYILLILVGLSFYTNLKEYQLGNYTLPSTNLVPFSFSGEIIESSSEAIVETDEILLPLKQLQSPNSF